jgi:hypothetical protein
MMEKEYEHCGCEFHGDRAGCHSECATRGCCDFQGMFSKDVHTEHCCMRHGCKYADIDCTVRSGQKEQSFQCEVCVYEHQQTDWIDPLVRGFFNMKNEEDCKRANALIDALVTKAREVF